MQLLFGLFDFSGRVAALHNGKTPAACGDRGSLEFIVREDEINIRRY
jgi:hypothetical protein